MDVITILLLVPLIVVAFVLGALFGKLLARHRFEKRVPTIREDAIARSRAVLSGQFSEQLAPYLPNFPYCSTEARFIGKPIDFIVFKGADDRNITDVIFVEVKSGASKINAHERALKVAIDTGRVKWEEYRVPEELTTKRY